MHRSRDKGRALCRRRTGEGYGLKLDERIVEYPWLFSRLPREEGGWLLDAGSILNYDYILAQEKLRNKKLFISTLAPEARNYCRKGISYVFEDLRDACYRDGGHTSYLIVSLSTLEHVGLDNTLLYTDDPSKKENLRDAYLSEFSNTGGFCGREGGFSSVFPSGHTRTMDGFRFLTAPW